MAINNDLWICPPLRTIGSNTPMNLNTFLKCCTRFGLVTEIRASVIKSPDCKREERCVQTARERRDMYRRQERGEICTDCKREERCVQTARERRDMYRLQERGEMCTDGKREERYVQTARERRDMYRLQERGEICTDCKREERCVQTARERRDMYKLQKLIYSNHVKRRDMY